MKYYSYLVILVLSLTAFKGMAQYNVPENSIWKFGGGAGYNFNTMAATNSVMSAMECAQAVADASGNLRFYTDGNRIWDLNNNPMPSANPIFPAPLVNVTQSTVQGALIVPFVNDNNKYYVFSLSAQELANNEGGKLYYSVVDMTLNGGLGDIVPGTAHTLIDTGFSEHMIAVPTCGGVWVILHGRISPVFKAYKIDANGLNTAPVLSQAGVQGYVGPGNSGNQGFPGNNFYNVGQLAVSPDFKQLAAAYFKGNLVELYSFNNTTGTIAAKGVVDSSNDAFGFYGVSFSPDSKKLYATNCAAAIGLKAFNQYNLALPTMAQIRASRFFLGPCNAMLSQLQLGPNGKIYLNGGYISKLGTIENPDLLGAAAGLSVQSTNLLSGTNVNYALQNTIMKPMMLTGDTFSIAWKDTLICNGDQATVTARAGGVDYHWNDGLTGAQRTINSAGLYWVYYTKNCAVYVDTLKVRIKTAGVSLGADTSICGYYLLSPSFEGVPSSFRWNDGSSTPAYLVSNPGTVSVEAIISGCTVRDTVHINLLTLYAALGDDTSFCAGEPINLSYEVDPPPNTSILWSTGSTDKKIRVNAPGTYGVVLSHPQCGTFADQVTIAQYYCDCEVAVPSAFSPNNDGKNDFFGVIRSEDCPVNGYILRIFNRWGQLVFESYEVDKSWNGYFEGKPAAQDVYFYYIQLNKGSGENRFQKKGDLMLLR